MLVIGLTGGIAAGKSSVANILKSMGAEIIDADKMGHKLIERGKPAYKEIVSAFGNNILDSEGNIDRKNLGKIVFNNTGKRERLNAILHPKIIEEEWNKIDSIKLKRPDATVVINAPLLIESGSYKDVDAVLLVVADEEEVVRRAMERDGLSRECVIERISSQMPVEEKKKYADHVIENKGTLEDLRRKVGELYRRLK